LPAAECRLRPSRRWSSSDRLESDAAQTRPSIGRAALEGQRVVHRAVRRSLGTLAIVALCTGVSVTTVAATAVNAGATSTATLRAEVDAVGSRFFAAQARAHTLDSEVQALDRRLTRDRRRAAALRPVAIAQAVQIYQGSSEGFTALFDTSSAMESARRAELIARAGDHTRALIDEYVNADAALSRQRARVARARAAQATVVAALATQHTALERALAQAQQAYRDRLAAEARARAISLASTRSAGTPPVQGAPTARPPGAPAPPAPVPVSPPPPPETGQNPHHSDPFLVCTRTRESSGDYSAVNLAGYYGAYQFGQSTWDVTANHAGSPQLIGVRPDQASAWDQDQLAWVLYEWLGNGPWGGLC
jgi:hypothetical protein